jgi:hypothetical protein
MRSSILISLILFSTSFAQLKIGPTSAIKIEAINFDFSVDSTWFDSLRYEANNNIFVFELASSCKVNNLILTRLRIPQVLTEEQVMRQVILYYAAHPTNIRKIEQVLVYPFFTAINQPPFLSCELNKNNIYTFVFRKWRTVIVKTEPTDVDFFIYDQIIKLASEKIYKFGSMPEEIITEIANQYHLSFSDVQTIYEYVILWEKSLRNMYK